MSIRAKRRARTGATRVGAAELSEWRRLFAGGASDGEIADAVGCADSTVRDLRERAELVDLAGGGDDRRPIVNRGRSR